MFTEFVDMQLKWKATLATLAARHHWKSTVPQMILVHGDFYPLLHPVVVTVCQICLHLLLAGR